MADNLRALRMNDPYRREPEGQPAPEQGDPLAELARLIGQSDPFAEFGKDDRRAQHSGGAPAPAYPADQAAPRAAQLAPAGGYSPAPAGYGQPASYQEPAYQDHDPNQGHGGGYAADPHYADPHAAQSGHGAGYAAHPEDTQHGYQPDLDYGDAPSSPQQDFYDDARHPAPRRTMVVVAAILGLAVIGTGGAFAYRSFFGGPQAVANPPVIRADATPKKVVPASQQDASNKLITDRVNTAQAERVVSHDEQPIQVKEAAPPPPSPFPPVNQGPPSAMTAPAGNGLVVDTVPKRVKTVTIRPDAHDASPPQGIAAAKPMPPAAAPRAAAPIPAMPPSASSARASSQPLSLAPGTSYTPPSAPPPAAPAPARTQQTASAATPVSLNSAAPNPAAGGGSYLVQVSSQRSEGEAKSAYRSLQGRFPQLGSQQLTVRRADLGSKGVFYRAMVGPFASANEASQFCGSLKSAGGQCVIQRN